MGGAISDSREKLVKKSGIAVLDTNCTHSSLRAEVNEQRMRKFENIPLFDRVTALVFFVAESSMTLSVSRDGLAQKNIANVLAQGISYLMKGIVMLVSNYFEGSNVDAKRAIPTTGSPSSMECISGVVSNNETALLA